MRTSLTLLSLGILTVGCAIGAVQKETTAATETDTAEWVSPCASLYEQQVEPAVIQEGPPLRRRPGFVMGLSGSRLARIDFSVEVGDFMVVSTATPFERGDVGFVVLDNGVYAVAIDDVYSDVQETCTAVARLNSESLAVERRACIRRDAELFEKHEDAPGAIATDGERIYISAMGDFIVLDRELNELGRTSLFVDDDRKKNAHDILVHDSIAYLLDDVIEPVYSFRVDVSDPRKPTVIQRFEPLKINAHLDEQWVIESPPMWIYKASHFTREGGSQSFDQLCLGDDDARLTGGKCLEAAQEQVVEAVVRTEVPLAFVGDLRSGASYLARGKYSTAYGFYFEKVAKFSGRIVFRLADYKDGFVYALADEIAGEERAPILVIIDVSKEKPTLVEKSYFSDILGTVENRFELGMITLNTRALLLVSDGEDAELTSPLVSLTTQERNVTSCIAPVPNIDPPATPDGGWYCQRDHLITSGLDCYETKDNCVEHLPEVFQPETKDWARDEESCVRHQDGFCLRMRWQYGDSIWCYPTLEECRSEWEDLLLEREFSDCIPIANQ